jgi:bifunctional DNA-binding transcriptional regulator/antitoxin component of YhaV-PrlF toxin-antitoxin module
LLALLVEIREKYKIEPGDYFEIEVSERNGELIMVTYKRLKPIV